MRPRICAVIINKDLEAIRQAEPLTDLFEVRIDLIGNGWQDIAKQLQRPWLACNRRADEGGAWPGNESSRIDELLQAIELGAGIVDLELRTGNLAKAVQEVKGRAQCLLSFHDLAGTPPLAGLREIVQRQIAAGADICKVITTARRFEDNLTVLQLIAESLPARVIAFAMGPLGLISRACCPLAGGDFTYASIEPGKESAPGQITVKEMRKLYEMMGNG